MTSRIGLSSYAFFWQLSDKVSAPMSIHDALERTAELGMDLFQVCDYAPIEAMTDAELQAVRDTADRLGIDLELGTKGIRPEHLRRFLHIAGILGSPLLRTMFNVPGHAPTTEEAVATFKDVLPEFEAAGVKIAVETYEQVPTSRVLDVIRSAGDAP
jgi:sugar phosphate isomerase/epimerase